MSAIAALPGHGEGRNYWKFALIEADNPDWDDLWDQWFAPDMAKK